MKRFFQTSADDLQLLSYNMLQFLFRNEIKLSTNEIISNIRKQKQLKKCITYLYKENYASIEKMILSMNGTTQDTEEVFQYTLSKVIWLIQDEHYKEGYSLTNYIYTLSRHMWVNTLKKRNNFSFFLLDTYHEDYKEELLEEIPFVEDNLYSQKEFRLFYEGLEPNCNEFSRNNIRKKYCLKALFNRNKALNI